MRKICLILFLISISFVAAFGQTQSQEPTDFLRKFWNLALQNDVAEAKKFVTGNILKDNDYAKLREYFTLVSERNLKIGETRTLQVFSQQAYYNFKVENEDKQPFFIEAILLLINGKWKVFYFRVRSGIVNTPDFPKSITPLPLIKGYPVSPFCPKCG